MDVNQQCPEKSSQQNRTCCLNGDMDVNQQCPEKSSQQNGRFVTGSLIEAVILEKSVEL
jgi:hypothetical protein